MDVVIIGAGGHGRVVLDIVRAAGEQNPVGFIDADEARAGGSVDGVKIIGAINLLPRLVKQGITGAIVAIGDNRVRVSYAEAVVSAGLELISAVHPTASTSPSVRIGRNVVVGPGAIITAEAQIGDSAIINSGAVVEHECRIGKGVHICPGALLGGRVEAGAGAFVGLGARVIPCMKIGQGAIVGAGAVVIRDVPEFATVVGVPAKVVKTSPRP